MGKSFGSYFKEFRTKKGITLRAFCDTYSLDPGNISRLESGVAKPPESSDILTRYATYLGLRKGSDEWHHFMDLAAAERGRVPSDIMSQKEKIERLPVLFRTMRRRKLSKEDYEKLLKKLEDL